MDVMCESCVVIKKKNKKKNPAFFARDQIRQRRV